MPLNNQQKRDISIRFADETFRDPDKGAAISMADLDAAAEALETWLLSNAASLNAALPVNVRTALTTEDKAILLAKVALTVGKQR